MKKEIWKDIPGYERLYQASNMGRIKALKKQWIGGCGVIRNKEEHIMVLSENKKGYLAVNLHKNSKKRYWFVHRLVLMSFCGDKFSKNKKLQVNHINCNKKDNQLHNLEFCTNIENQKHAMENNLKVGLKGDSHPSSKLTESQVRRILFLHKNGVERGYWFKVANSLNVTVGCIRVILYTKNCWKHLKVSP